MPKHLDYNYMCHRIILFSLLVLFVQQSLAQTVQSQIFDIQTKKNNASIFYNENGSTLDSITAFLLAEDIYKVTGKRPFVTSKKKELKTENIIAIGEIGTNFINSFLKGLSFPKKFKEQKESYLQKIVQNPFSKLGKAFVIAGTDAKGTAFGVFDLSEKIGISPWYFWADVPVQKKKQIQIIHQDYFSEEPSVAYRGIFLNDEDWGLQPWAEKTFEPKVGDIGPKTYAKIFELLLRLKANTIWPAMHPSTKAFFHYSGNPKMAKQYHIVVGSSHAEPMLRNNVDEWKEDSLGPFNYVSNKDNVYKYWEQRVKEAQALEAIYTIGMRGVHDSGMEGVESLEQAKEVLSEVIKDQRGLLKEHINKDVDRVPQAFTVYKEVLELYDHGLILPEDVTIVWTDDNYGYIRRLSNEKERKREGGGGVYYHASYWGRPHDYLWLSSTHPSLIREEMFKAYQTNSKEIWILNVGDIKPAAYNIQLFMDMAYNIGKFEDPEFLPEHMTAFYDSIFGRGYGEKISSLKYDYYDLAFERKPEFMGWSQTEPTTEVKNTAYDPFSWGDEIKNRVENYERLAEKAEQIQQKLPKRFNDPYFELVYYPIKAAALMNKKFLYRDKAMKYSRQNRLVAKHYKELSQKSYDSIKMITVHYNTQIADGKWNHMMSMSPRNLPVFEKPEIPLEFDQNSSSLAGIAVENAKFQRDYELPTYYNNSTKTHFFDIFLKEKGTVSWSLQNLPDWLNLNKDSGALSTGKNAQQRITVGIDWEKWKAANKPKETKFKVNVGSEAHVLHLKVKSYESGETEKNIFIEKNGVVSIYAENYTDKRNEGSANWKKISGLGYSNNIMQASPVTAMPLDTLVLESESPYLAYTFYTESTTNHGELILNALPTHPITNKHSVRVGVQLDEKPIKIVDFRTYGRSEEWKSNVLRNLAKIKVPIQIKEAGKHILKIYMIDQGVSLDFIYIKIKDDIDLPYGLLEETRTE